MRESPVRRYSGQTEHVVRLGNLRRTVPVVQIKPHTWIASDAALILGDVGFLSKASSLLARRLRNKRIDAVLTAEAKSIALAFELSRKLHIERFVVARKGAKSYMRDYTSQRVQSITTKAEQELLLTKEEMRWLSGKRVCLLDDVVSTGATLEALRRLAEDADATIACRAAVWKEGPWYKARDLVYIEALPIFVDE